MAEFSGASLWMKLTMMLISGAFSMHLFSMDQPYGWSGYTVCDSIGCNNNAVRAVQALEVIGFLSVLTALFLSLCLVLLDELKGNKIALICLSAFSLLAGSFTIVEITLKRENRFFRNSRTFVQRACMTRAQRVALNMQQCRHN